MKRREFPIMMSRILASPPMQVAPSPVHRAVVYLAIAYWQSGCLPLPTDNTTLAAFVRTPVAHLKPIKAAVLAILEEITPHLDRDYAKLTRRQDTLEAQARDMVVRRIAKMAARMSADLSQPSPVPLPLRGDQNPAKTEVPSFEHSDHAPPPSRRPAPRSAPAFGGTFRG